MTEQTGLAPARPLDRERRVFETGTTEIAAAPLTFRTGAISFSIDGGALRRLALGAVELVRQIDFPIRDRNWATLPPEVTYEGQEETETGVRYERRFSVDDGALVCRVVYEIDRAGVITATGEARATRDFVTNRSGFTVLHPIAGVAGRPVRVTAPDGSVREAVMPDRISPAQPVRDIAGLAFEIEGIAVELGFEGETFEMEDQRNWSDASFKTYCRPLVEPFAYVIAAGSTIRQQIRVSVAGDGLGQAAPDEAPVAIGAATGEAPPELLLAGEGGWLPDAAGAALAAESGVRALLLRVTPDDVAARLGEAAPLLVALGGALDLEIVLADDGAAEPQLARVAAACRTAGVSPRHVMALPAAYLASYQPGGRWPTGLSPAAAFTAARTAFPEALVGAGVLTNFTEFNRCRPTGLACDHVSHGTAAIVHAADDLSVVQTLEALPDIFRSARAIGGAAAYRLGLVAIGMRSNPYGDAVSANPDQRRLTMATWDPRARGLLGAAWAVGALAATEGCGVEAITLAAPAGPFGIVATPGAVARPWWDAHAEARVYPIFHVLRALDGAGVRHRLSGLPDGVVGLAFATDRGLRLVAANLGPETRRLALAPGDRVAVLDTTTFEAAAADPRWLDHALMAVATPAVALDPAAILFLDRSL